MARALSSLPVPVSPLDQDGNIRVGDGSNEAEQLPHFVTVTENPGKTILPLDFRAEPVVFLRQRLSFDADFHHTNLILIGLSQVLEEQLRDMLAKAIGRDRSLRRRTVTH